MADPTRLDPADAAASGATDEANAELLREFVDEAIMLTESVSSLLLLIERAWESGDPHQAMQKETLRAFHTLKGNAGMMGLGRIEAVAHGLEDLLVQADEPSFRTPQVIDALIVGSDLLSALVQATSRGEPDDGATEAFLSHVAQVAAAVHARHPQRHTTPPSSSPREPPPRPGLAPGSSRTTTSSPPPGDPVAPIGAASVRIQIERLDQMVDLTSEVAILESQLTRTTQALLYQYGGTSEVSRLERATISLHKAVQKLRRGLLEARLLPLSTIFYRLERTVRDGARERGQPIDLSTTGGDAAVDKAIIERIIEPLMHILRNAIAHGIETPEARARAGKREEATITLAARSTSERIEVTVADDGRGLDLEAIRVRARELGHETRELSAEATQQLIFVPGLSTASSVGRLAGRGVGLDVVATTIQALGGRIEVRSAPGLGTAFVLDLPITLAMIKALLVEVDGETYALPTGYVVESMRAEAATSAVHERLGFGILPWREQAIHVIDAGDLLETPPPPEPRGEGRRYCVVLSVGARKRGILVDALVGYQEIIVKPLDGIFGPLHRISGAAVLGDGQVVLVLDVPRIAGVHGDEPSVAPDAGRKGALHRRDARAQAMHRGEVRS
jgi:two-component system, chemotaxis family, sensor kinase CheA